MHLFGESTKAPSNWQEGYPFLHSKIMRYYKDNKTYLNKAISVPSYFHFREKMGNDTSRAAMIQGIQENVTEKYENFVHSHKQENAQNEKNKVAPPETPRLTLRQIESKLLAKESACLRTHFFSFFSVIKNSWRVLSLEIDQIGMLAFLKLFQSHPEVKNTFKTFQGMSQDQLEGSDIFRNHSSRVTAVIKKVVEKIDDPESYLPYLRILGEKHIQYEANVQHVDKMGYMFLAGIQPVLEREVRLFSFHYLVFLIDFQYYYSLFGTRRLEMLGKRS